MDYPCGKFGDCSFSCFGSIMRTNRHTHTDTDERFTPATFVGVSKNNFLLLSLPEFFDCTKISGCWGQAPHLFGCLGVT